MGGVNNAEGGCFYMTGGRFFLGNVRRLLGGDIEGILHVYSHQDKLKLFSSKSQEIRLFFSAVCACGYVFCSKNSGGVFFLLCLQISGNFPLEMRYAKRKKGEFGKFRIWERMSLLLLLFLSFGAFLPSRILSTKFFFFFESTLFCSVCVSQCKSPYMAS